ncbi:MAG: hypothetical protein PVH84_18580, partial [Candidatus Aminicenantes bacterium]
MKKTVILSTILFLIFLSLGSGSDNQWTEKNSGANMRLIELGNTLEFTAGESAAEQKRVRIWGNVGTVVLGYDPAEQKPLIYATELSSGDIYQFIGQWR